MIGSWMQLCKVQASINQSINLHQSTATRPSVVVEEEANKIYFLFSLVFQYFRHTVLQLLLLQTIRTDRWTIALSDDSFKFWRFTSIFEFSTQNPSKSFEQKHKKIQNKHVWWSLRLLWIRWRIDDERDNPSPEKHEHDPLQSTSNSPTKIITTTTRDEESRGVLAFHAKTEQSPPHHSRQKLAK